MVIMTTHTIFEVYDKNDNYVGYYLYNEETLAKKRADELGGHYVKTKALFG